MSYHVIHMPDPRTAPEADIRRAVQGVTKAAKLITGEAHAVPRMADRVAAMVDRAGA
jgi:hypothetical protein